LPRLASVTLHGYFRDVEVIGRQRLPARGPSLLVANHVNGFVDPVVIVHVAGRLPRFVAKATLWKIAPLRGLLRRLGVLPVARRQDALDAAVNVDTFAAANRALADGATVAIFPEGTAHDEPHMLPIRTGAARMALGARAEGARDLRIVPVGIVFDDKLALRSRVLATVGDPIDLDSWAVARGEPTVDEADRDAVRALTLAISARLGELTPAFESLDEARAFTRAAEVALRSGALGEEAPLGRVTALSARLSQAGPAARDAVLAAFGQYQLALDLVGLSDDELVSVAGPRRLVMEALGATARTVGLAPWAVVGAAVNALPYGLVRLAGGLARKPANKGSLRVLAGIVCFPLAWVGAGVVVGRRRGAWAGVATGVVAAVGGYATVLEFERFATLRRAWRGAERRFDLRSRVDQLLASRAALIEAVGAAAGDENRYGLGRGAALQ
jgi:1-acyl-sn-glycerol-3-phosphate acyltransferase